MYKMAHEMSYHMIYTHNIFITFIFNKIGTLI